MRQTASPLKVSVPTQLQGHSDRAETVTLGLVRPFPQWLLFAIHGELRPAGFSEADLGPWSRLSGGHSTEGCAEVWRADALLRARRLAPFLWPQPLWEPQPSAPQLLAGGPAGRRRVSGRFQLLQLCLPAGRPRRGLTIDCSMESITGSRLVAVSPSCEQRPFEDCCQGEPGRHG